jgi:exopolysaccharide production protein ExoY
MTNSKPLVPHHNRSQEIGKRAVDLTLGLILGIASAPVLLAVYLAIRLISNGPGLYRHTRIGKDGQCFELWKFRSMVINAEEVLSEHLATNPEARAEWELTQKLKDDPRVLPIGRWLRKTSLDELPQFWNVIRGDMSLVGPRPITRDEMCRYADASDAYKAVRPGMTGLWQVSGRSSTSYVERVALDEHYVATRSIWLDLHILIRTAPALLLREGAC